MRETKQVAATFNDGKGVPFMSPWQVTRAAREQAEKDGRYNSASLAETAEATNIVDLLIAMLAPTDNTNRNADITIQILKNRDGEKQNDILVSVDYATAKFSSRGLLSLSPTTTQEFNQDVLSDL